MHSTKARILYTEDDPDSREVLTEVLKRNGYEVVWTEDTPSALQLCRQELFDLILLDNWTPIMDGCTLTGKIREFDQVTPILFYSGAATKSDFNAAKAAGAQGYLTKPTGIDQLTDEIDGLILKSRLQKNHIPH